jgi:hypothetical protein
MDMLSNPLTPAGGSASEPRQAAALQELLVETIGRRRTPPAALDETALLFIAAHPALSRDRQEVLLLRAALWFEPEEIAWITRLTLASVGTRLRGAYRRLRSTGLGAPHARVGCEDRAQRALEILELLYWRADGLADTHAELAQRLHQGVLSRIRVLAGNDGSVGGEANGLLAFLWLSMARLGDPGFTPERGRRYLRAADHAGASGRYVWLARIIAAQLSPGVPDWHRIAVMWEVIHELGHASAPRWLRNPLARLAEDDVSA